jgi:thioredoxin 1
VLDQLAEEYGDKIAIGKVNVDDEIDLATKFQVSSIPTLLIMKDGEVQQRFVGVTSKQNLAEAIDAACG